MPNRKAARSARGKGKGAHRVPVEQQIRQVEQQLREMAQRFGAVLKLQRDTLTELAAALRRIDALEREVRDRDAIDRTAAVAMGVRLDSDDLKKAAAGWGTPAPPVTFSVEPRRWWQRLVPGAAARE